MSPVSFPAAATTFSASPSPIPNLASVVNAAYAANLPVTPYSEALLELTYQAQIMAGWTLQPVAQYIVEPGAGLGGTRLRNAAVVGLRTTIAY